MSSAEKALREIESHFAVALGDAARVAEACAELQGTLSGAAGPEAAAVCLNRLLPLLSRHADRRGVVLFDFLESEARAATDPGPLASGMLGVRDETLRARAAALLLDLLEEGRIPLREEYLLRLAAFFERGTPPPPSPELLERLEPLLRAHDPKGAGSLLVTGGSREVRALAAAVLDRPADPPTAAICREVLGSDAAAFLEPYLAFTAATHRDLVDITPQGPGDVPLLPSLRAAQEVLGTALLRTVISELGWARLAWGLTARAVVALQVDGGFPYLVSPAEAAFIESCGGTTRLWERFLVTAHGGFEGNAVDPTAAAPVARFRSHNLAHAEALAEILSVAPMTAARARRILACMDRIVTGFADVFAGRSADADAVGPTYARLRAPVDQALHGAAPEEVLPAEATRILQAFEDPPGLDTVRTLHGLKRYLHQQGLRLAFRLFPAMGSGNRTIDLVIATHEGVSHLARSIRYLDFEPDASRPPCELPYPAAMLVEALAPHLLHGRRTFPFVEILCFGNEIQIYLSFRNHPALLRLDLSPPLRGGMIDLEYYGASLYEIDHHPDLSLAAIERLFQRVGCDVDREGLRLHVRYDKECAFDLADLLEKTRLFLRLVPCLMDLDWTVGGLDYPAAVRRAIADHWTEFFLNWGVLPFDQFLTGDRRHILAGMERGPAGDRELPWDGNGAVRDRFHGAESERESPFAARLGELLRASGLAEIARWDDAPRTRFGQLALESYLLAPLRGALARGELVVTPQGPRPVPAGGFERNHEAIRLATLLGAGDEELAAAAGVAAAIATVERMLRFQTTGEIQGYAVERATLLSPEGTIGLYVLRDAAGTPAVGIAAPDEVLYRGRATPDSPWHNGPTLRAGELLRLFRRVNCITAGEAPPPPPSQAGLRGRFRIPHASRPPAREPGDRIITGTPASPGRASGFVRLGVAGHDPEELAGSVLIAPAIQPEDAPLLRSAAAVVSTGGGILSHVGMLALELRKPALIIPGRWSREGAEETHLACPRRDFVEEVVQVGPYRVTLRCGIRETEETLREGDLVSVDATAGSLLLLGRDRIALAMHRALQQLSLAASRIPLARDPQAILTLRGSHLHAVHELEKLLGAVDRPALARFAVEELLTSRGEAGEPAHRSTRARLLRTLFANRTCGAAARACAARRLQELEERHDTLLQNARCELDALPDLFALLYLRLRILELSRARDEVRALVAGDLPDAPPAAAPREAEVERAFIARLLALRDDVTHRLERAESDPASHWKARHLRAAVDRFDRVLRPRGEGETAGPPPPPSPSLPPHLTGRVLLFPQDGGAELAPLAGPKGANLGELARILGAGSIPHWFTVTTEAFHRLCDAPLSQSPMRLGEAIADVLARRDWPPARKADAVRRLWADAPFPADVAAEIRAAYHALATDPDKAEPHVAVRSSELEEDTERSAWAGQFDTFLYVRGADSVLDHVRRVWASFWSERALRHRERLGSAESAPAGAVVVQRMIDAEAAGVMHTVSVAAGELGEMVVNAGLGMGEGVVSGAVDVDEILVDTRSARGAEPLRFRYRVGDKRERVVLDARRGCGTRREPTLYHQRFRPALAYEEIRQLAAAGLAAQEVFGRPLDLEFAFRDGRLHVLQVRPIPVFQNAWEETIAREPLAGRDLPEVAT